MMKTPVFAFIDWCARKAGKTALLSIGLLLFSSCVTVDFSGPTTSFQKSVNTSVVAVSGYLTNLNEFERHLYLDQRAYDESLDVLAIDSNGAQTPLLGQQFTADSIKARTNALALIGAFAQKLSDLAGSATPGQLATDFTGLGDSLTTLGASFDALSKRNDKTAISYITPVTAIVGSLGKMYLTNKRDEAVKIAIVEGAPEVEKVLKLLDADLNDVVKPLQETGLQQQLALQVAYYNNHRDHSKSGSFGSLDERKAHLAEISSAADAYGAIIAFNPSNLVNSVRKSLDALVTYATGSHDPKTFADMIAALQALEQNAQDLATQAEKIHQLNKG